MPPSPAPASPQPEADDKDVKTANGVTFILNSDAYHHRRAALRAAIKGGGPSTTAFIKDVEEWSTVARVERFGNVRLGVKQTWRDETHFYVAAPLLAAAYAALSMQSTGKKAAEYRAQSFAAHATLSLGQVLEDLVECAPADGIIHWLEQLALEHPTGYTEKQRQRGAMSNHRWVLTLARQSTAPAAAQVAHVAADALRRICDTLPLKEQPELLILLGHEARLMEVYKDLDKAPAATCTPATELARIYSERGDFVRAKSWWEQARTVERGTLLLTAETAQTLATELQGLLQQSRELAAQSEMLAGQPQRRQEIEERRDTLQEQREEIEEQLAAPTKQLEALAKQAEMLERLLPYLPESGPQDLLVEMGARVVDIMNTAGEAAKPQAAARALTLLALQHEEHTTLDPTPLLTQALRCDALPPHALAHLWQLARRQLDQPATSEQAVREVAQALLWSTQRDGADAQLCAILLRCAERLSDQDLTQRLAKALLRQLAEPMLQATQRDEATAQRCATLLRCAERLNDEALQQALAQALPRKPAKAKPARGKQLRPAKAALPQVPQATRLSPQSRDAEAQLCATLLRCAERLNDKDLLRELAQAGLQAVRSGGAEAQLCATLLRCAERLNDKDLLRELGEAMRPSMRSGGAEAQLCATWLRCAELLNDKDLLIAAHTSLASVDQRPAKQLAAATYLASQGRYNVAADLLQSARQRPTHGAAEPELLLLLAQTAGAAAARAKNDQRARYAKMVSSALHTVLAQHPDHREALLRLAQLSKYPGSAAKLYRRAAEAYQDAGAAALACEHLQRRASALLHTHGRKLASDFPTQFTALASRLEEQASGLETARAQSKTSGLKMASMQNEASAPEKASTEDFALWLALMDDFAGWLQAASQAAQVPVQEPAEEPEAIAPTAPKPAPGNPVAAAAQAQDNPLHTDAGELIGLNYQDLPVLRRPDGSLLWSYDGALSRRWRAHSAGPLANVPSEHRHDVPAEVRASLDANLALHIAGGKTLGDYMGAILAGGAEDDRDAGGDAERVCLLRGSRVHTAILEHFARQRPDLPRSAALLAHLADRAARGEISDIDIGTNVPPDEVFARCANLATAQGAFGSGGLAAHWSSKYHGACSFHDRPGAALHLDICSFITEGSLAPKARVEGADCLVYPAVFGNCLRAWAEQQAFAPLFYDFQTGQVYDPTGRAWAELQEGCARVASEAALTNPMLPLLAAKLAPLQLHIAPDDLSAMRQHAQQLLADPRLALQQLVRAAPAGLPNAAALLAWTQGPLAHNMQAMGLDEVHQGLLAACDEAALLNAYGRRTPGFALA